MKKVQKKRKKKVSLKKNPSTSNPVTNVDKPPLQNKDTSISSLDSFYIDREDKPSSTFKEDSIEKTVPKSTKQLSLPLSSKKTTFKEDQEENKVVSNFNTANNKKEETESSFISNLSDSN